MTPDELWEKHTACGAESGYMIYEEFLDALKEYGESVRQQAVRVCRQHAQANEVRGNVIGTFPDAGHIGEMHIQGSYIARDCAAAIEKMELP